MRVAFSLTFFTGQCVLADELLLQPIAIFIHPFVRLQHNFWV